MFQNCKWNNDLLNVTRPCRQRNNNAICGVALCHIAPVCDGQCSIVIVKAVQEGTSITEQAWQRSTKRMECDELISSMHGVAFNNSAVSTFWVTLTIQTSKEHRRPGIKQRRRGTTILFTSAVKWQKEEKATPCCQLLDSHAITNWCASLA